MTRLLPFIVTVIVTLAAMPFCVQAQSQVNIIPYPNEVKMGEGVFEVNENCTVVSHDKELKSIADLLTKAMRNVYRFNYSSEVQPAKDGRNIHLKFNKDSDIKPEGYQLTITRESINIAAPDAAGVFYATQSLLQLMYAGNELPTCIINDAPRFGYRGMMLDVARHFQPVSYVKQLLDQLALLKINRFHWHLTEDQGWRIEIKKYPKLTEKGAWRNGTIIGHYPGTGNDNQRYGGFYTQEEVKEVVRYAAQRFITVIPEIEMPGHSGAAIAAYPWLSCFPEEGTVVPHHPSNQTKKIGGKQVQESWGVYEDVYAPTEKTFQFLQDVIDEVVQLFPAPYIHIGGDECPKESWKRSAFCQQLIKEKGLKDEHGLQSYFIGRMEKYINSKGKKIIGWDEILEGGLAPNATVMSWRGEKGGIEAALQKHDVIMTPTSHCYLDYSQTKNEDSLVIGGYLPLEQVYQYEPVPEELSGKSEAKYVLGTQANLWTEYVPNSRKLEYMLFPRLAALAEVSWTQPERKSWERFQSGLPAYFTLLEKQGVNSSKAFYELAAAIVPAEDRTSMLWQLDSKLPQSTVMYKSPAGNFTQYTKPVSIMEEGVWQAQLVNNSKVVSSIAQPFMLHKAVGKHIKVSPSPARKYSGNNGVNGLVNGVISHNGLISAEWLGWEGIDMEAIIDFGSSQTIEKLVLYSLESKGSWIYPPAAITISASEDGISFREVFKQDISSSTSEKSFREIACNFGAISTTYLRINVRHFGTIPAGMAGAGNGAWLFIDEIAVY